MRTLVFWAPRRAPLLQVLKSAVATIVAWTVAGFLVPGQVPVFAAIAALLVVQPSLNQSLAKAVERSIGVVAGVVVAVLLGFALGNQQWVILLAVLLALLIAWALRLTSGAGNQVAISAMLVLTLGVATSEYAVDRIFETLIGAAIGFIVNLLIVPPVSLGPAHEKVRALGAALADALDRLAGAMVSRSSPDDLLTLLADARAMRRTRDAAAEALAAGAESLTLNPRARRHRAELTALDSLVERLSPVVTQTIGMTRAFVDEYHPDLRDDPTVLAIAEQLLRAAHDVRLLLIAADHSDPQPARTIGDDPALTRPLRVVGAPPQRWTLVGSLLIDLRRIHERLREPV